jgi:hypothetical protein
MAVSSARIETCQGIARRSITATIMNKIMPIAIRMSSADQTSGPSRLPVEVSNRYPRPLSDPTNSPTMAPTTARQMAILNPANICGSAEGALTRSMIFVVSAPIERTRSTMSLSTLFKPTTVDTTMGKNEIKNTIAIFGRIPKPSQTTRIGAIATLGIVCDITRMGIDSRSIVRLSTIAKAMGRPTTTLAAKPVSTENRVNQLFFRRMGHSRRIRNSTCCGAGKR